MAIAEQVHDHMPVPATVCISVFAFTFVFIVVGIVIVTAFINAHFIEAAAADYRVGLGRNWIAAGISLAVIHLDKQPLLAAVVFTAAKTLESVAAAQLFPMQKYQCKIGRASCRERDKITKRGLRLN